MREVLSSLAILSYLLAVQVAYAEGEVAQSATAHLTISLSGPAAVKGGDDIQLKITLSNQSQSPIRDEISDSTTELGGNNKFFVTDPRGKNLPPNIARSSYQNNESPRPPMLADSFRVLRLNRGESLDETCVISRLFSMKKPGTYIVQIRNRLRDGFSLKSNKIAVTVRP